MVAFRRVWWPVGLALAVGVGSAWADMVYRWTDAQGVVHFADVPPSGAGPYTAQPLPDAPTVAPPPPTAETPASTPSDATQGASPPAAATPGTGTPAAGAPGAATPAPTSPARVVIAEREQTTVGDSRQSFTGKVKNEGGEEARNVVVTIRVVEPTQGDECLNDEIEVEPSTLAPGASGTFEAEFDSPCFRGPTQTELGVLWE